MAAWTKYFVYLLSVAIRKYIYKIEIRGTVIQAYKFIHPYDGHLYLGARSWLGVWIVI